MIAASDELRERTRNAIKSQKRPTVTVLSSLLAAHDELGFLPEESIEEVAVYTDKTINEVWGVASFYTNFRFSPPGRHLVEVCWGPTCHLSGAAGILQVIQSDLGLTDEGDSKDGNVTLKYNTCLGACTQAPVMSVDHRLTGRLTEDVSRRLIKDLLTEES